eukprot:Clim_evm64s236 gene=Clim_evmTU64s236
MSEQQPQQSRPKQGPQRVFTEANLARLGSKEHRKQLVGLAAQHRYEENSESRRKASAHLPYVPSFGDLQLADREKVNRVLLGHLAEFRWKAVNERSRVQKELGELRKLTDSGKPRAKVSTVRPPGDRKMLFERPQLQKMVQDQEHELYKWYASEMTRQAKLKSLNCTEFPHYLFTEHKKFHPHDLRSWMVRTYDSLRYVPFSWGELSIRPVEDLSGTVFTDDAIRLGRKFCIGAIMLSNMWEFNPRHCCHMLITHQPMEDVMIFLRTKWLLQYEDNQEEMERVIEDESGVRPSLRRTSQMGGSHADSDDVTEPVKFTFGRTDTHTDLEMILDESEENQSDDYLQYNCSTTANGNSSVQNKGDETTEHNNTDAKSDIAAGGRPSSGTKVSFMVSENSGKAGFTMGAEDDDHDITDDEGANDSGNSVSEAGSSAPFFTRNSTTESIDLSSRPQSMRSSKLSRASEAPLLEEVADMSLGSVPGSPAIFDEGEDDGYIDPEFRAHAPKSALNSSENSGQHRRSSLMKGLKSRLSSSLKVSRIVEKTSRHAPQSAHHGPSHATEVSSTTTTASPETSEETAEPITMEDLMPLPLRETELAFLNDIASSSSYKTLENAVSQLMTEKDPPFFVIASANSDSCVVVNCRNYELTTFHRCLPGFMGQDFFYLPERYHVKTTARPRVYCQRNQCPRYEGSPQSAVLMDNFREHQDRFLERISRKARELSWENPKYTSLLNAEIAKIEEEHADEPEDSRAKMIASIRGKFNKEMDIKERKMVQSLLLQRRADLNHTCARCGVVFYCSTECGKSDYKHHGPVCLRKHTVSEDLGSD